MFRGSYYKICSSPKENEKKFAQSATFAMDKVVVFADDNYGYILVNYGGHKAFNDLKEKHGNELPALKKCTGAYNVTKAEAKSGTFFCGRCFNKPLPKKVATVEDFQSLWNQFGLIEFTFSVEDHPSEEGMVCAVLNVDKWFWHDLQCDVIPVSRPVYRGRQVINPLPRFATEMTSFPGLVVCGKRIREDPGKRYRDLNELVGTSLDPILRNLGPPGGCPPCFSKQTDELKQNPFHDRVVASIPFTSTNDYLRNEEDLKEHSVSFTFKRKQ